MKRITAISIAAGISVAAYLAGTLNPSDAILVRAAERGFDTSQQSIVATHKMVKPVGTAELCVPWWTNTNVKEARRRMCGK